MVELGAKSEKCNMRTIRIAEIIEEKTGAPWFDCVRAANEVSICLKVEAKKSKVKKK